jgi:hypothetical protein
MPSHILELLSQRLEQSEKSKLKPVLSQINLINILTPWISILILSFHVYLPLPTDLFRFSYQNFVYISYLLCVLHAPPISSYFIWST